MVISRVEMLELNHEDEKKLVELSDFHLFSKGITTRVILKTENSIVLKMVQATLTSPDPLKKSEIYKIGLNVFTPFAKGKSLIFHISEFRMPDYIKFGTLKWIRQQTIKSGINRNQFVKETGLSREKLDDIIDRGMPMTRLENALIYYYLIAKTGKHSIENNPDEDISTFESVTS
jgi:hypothetical protein